MRPPKKKIDLKRHKLMVLVTKYGTFPRAVDYHMRAYTALLYAIDLSLWADSIRDLYKNQRKNHAALMNHCAAIVNALETRFPGDVAKLRKNLNRALMEAEVEKAAREAGLK